MKHKISLELLAAKFAAAANHDAPATRAALAAEPRARELLLWLQARSCLDGGLVSLAEQFSTFDPGLVGTPTMRRLHGKSFTAKDREAILREIPGESSYLCYGDNGATKQAQWLSENLWRHVSTAHINRHSPFEYPIRVEQHEEFIDTLDRAAFDRLCRDFIREFLPAELHLVCTQKDAWFEPAWYCQDLVSALIQIMDATAAGCARSLAATAVASAVFDALEFAIQRKTFVRLDGNSRYGKTECLRTFAAMHPGKCRLITADCMNTDKDFFGAIADALGIERDYKTTAHRLRMKIDYIAHWCGLCWIWDEAHFLMPSVLTKSKRPTRLDWIRSHLVDRGSPVVIVTTPQIYDPAAKRLREVTGYNFDQWDGRIRRHVKLPEKISAGDILAIVQKKAPALSSDWQEEIAQAARLVPGSYLAAVNSIIDTAHWIAQRAGRATPNDSDLETAIAEVAPNAVEIEEFEDQAHPPAPRSQRRHQLVRPRPGLRPAATAAAVEQMPAPPARQNLGDGAARSITPETNLQPV